MTAEPAPAAHRRTVAARILLSFAAILVVFGLSGGWSLYALRSSAREAALMRDGYLPLALSLRDLVANQDNWNSQLNHVTTARNPAANRVWFETALTIGRPKKLAEVRGRIQAAFSSVDAHTAAVGAELLAEMSRIERYLSEDDALVTQLFDSLHQQEEDRARKLRDQLVTRGSRAKRLLSDLEQRVQGNVDRLLDQARDREQLGVGILSALLVLTLLVGLLVAFNARRVLRPLSVVTERARAVAGGDLIARPPMNSGDELGELSATFERMVQAIAEANQKLLATERLATIGKMAAHVTHEIRNPLSSIALNLELLEEELSPGADEARSLVHAMSREVERLSALSGQYLSMARRQQPHLEEENLGEIAVEACDFVRPELARHHVELELRIEETIPKVLLDEAQIKQALFNLLRNAREAMADGGKVTVIVRATATEAVLAVEDNGPGIEADAADRLFDPFFTTKGHGTGLGLAVTRQVVLAHGGRIEYRAAPGGGSHFELTFPFRTLTTQLS